MLRAADQPGVLIPRPKAKRRARSGRWLYKVVPLLVILTVWEIVGRIVGKVMLPTVTAVATSLYTLTLDRTLPNAFALSAQSLVLGFAVSATLGVAVGLAMGLLPFFDRALNMYVSILIATPVSAAVPLVVAGMGLGLASKATVVILFSIGVIILNTCTAVKGVDRELVEMGVSFRAGRAQLVRRIVLPAALPLIMAGLRLGLGLAVTGMVVSELFIIADGIGLLILKYSSAFQTANLFAVTVATIALGVFVLHLFSLVETRLMRHRRQAVVE